MMVVPQATSSLEYLWGVTILSLEWQLYPGSSLKSHIVVHCSYHGGRMATHNQYVHNKTMVTLLSNPYLGILSLHKELIVLTQPGIYGMEQRYSKWNHILELKQRSSRIPQPSFPSSVPCYAFPSGV